MILDTPVEVRVSDVPGNASEQFLSLWVNGRLLDTFPFGLRRKRISWLPYWMPFNSRWDTSFTAKEECYKILYSYGYQLWKIREAQIEVMSRFYPKRSY